MVTPAEISDYLDKILNSIASGPDSIRTISQQIRDKVATQTTVSSIDTTASGILSQLQTLVGTFGEAFVTVDRSALALSEGRRYGIEHIYTNQNDNTTVNMTIENPAGSGVTYAVTSVTFIIAGKAELTVSKNPNVSVTGTQITPVNQRVGATGTSTANVYYGNTLTTGTDVEKYLSPAGKLNRTLGQSALAPYQEIEEGNQISLQVYNDSGKTYDIQLIAQWDEEVNL